MDSEQLVEQIEKIFDADLIEDARRLCGLWLCYNDVGDILRARVLAIQGDCFFHNNEFFSAIENYNRVSYLRRLFKLTNKQAMQIKLDDASISFKIYRCYMAQKNVTDARKILESVAAKNRTPRISCALARLYEKAGQDRTAQSYYKEVVREFPLAFDSMVKLASLGAKTADYVPALVENFPWPNNVDWLTFYLKAENLKYTGYYINATEILRQLSSETCLKNNMDILISLAECEYFSGNYESALSLYNRILSVNRYHVQGMEVYSSLLYSINKRADLSRLNERCPESKESAVACGFYSLMVRKIHKSLVFAQKVLSENEWNIEACLLKGYSLFHSKRLKQASAEFSRAYQRVPFRYEVVKGLMDCFNATVDTKSAFMLAQNVKKNISSNPKFAIIYANTVSFDVNCLDKARIFLEGVNKTHPSSLEIVYALVDIYKRSGLLIRAQEMIQAALREHSTTTLHYKYGLVLLKLKNYRDAMEHFNLSLLIDPTNKDARKMVEHIDAENFTNIFSDVDIEPDLADLASESDNENIMP